MKKSILLIGFIFGLLVSSLSIAAPEYVDGTSDYGTAQTDNPLANENIGLYAIETIMKGVSTDEPDEYTLFGVLSKYLNITALALALTVIGKHGLQWLTLSTTKGVPGGGQMAGGTIMLRSALAMSMLMPVVGNGFSPIQLIVKETAELGVYIADEALEETVEYLTGNNKEKSTTNTFTPVTLTGMSDVVNTILKNETCHRVIDDYYEIDRIRGLIAPSTDPTPFKLAMENDSQVIYQWGWKKPYDGIKEVDDDLCGTVILNVPEALQGYVNVNDQGTNFTVDQGDIDPEERYYIDQMNAHHEAILAARDASKETTRLLLADQTMMTSLTALRYESTTVQQIQQYLNKAKRTEDQINDSLPTYATTMRSIDRVYAVNIRSQGQAIAQRLNQQAITTDRVNETLPYVERTWSQALEDQGFAALGAYYWIILKSNFFINSLQQHIAIAGTEPKLYEPNAANIDEDIMVIVNKENWPVIIERLNEVKNLQNQITDKDDLEMNFSALRYSDNVDGEQNIVLNYINKIGKGLTSAIESMLINSTSKDLIINMSNIGIYIMTALEAFLVAAVVAMLFTKATPIGKAVSTVSTFLTGGSGIASALSSIFGYLMPFILLAVTIGFVLKFVLPAIPLIKWLIALQSWAIMLFMVMVYAPIWMMSMASASTENWIDDKTKDGFIMLAEVLLRPILMIAGFYAGMQLMFIADIGARIAMPYLIGLAGQGLFGVLSIIAVLVLSGVFVYKLVTRSFDLIYEVPDFIIERMGGRPLGDVIRDDTDRTTIVAAGQIGETAKGGLAKGAAVGGKGK